MNTPFFPPAASSLASETDRLYFALLVLSAVVMLLVFVPMIYFLFKYRRGRPANRAPLALPTNAIEITWTLVPTLISLGFFAAGAAVYFKAEVPPADFLGVNVVGKQWMWKVQHAEGNREINELHVPVGQAIKLTMGSEDIIHSFYIPAFRIKQDVVPGRFSTEWFQPTRTGVYRFYCSEYCGMNHAKMEGLVYVMSRADYARWLGSGSQTNSLARSGELLYRSLGCSGCHSGQTIVPAPRLEGLYGSRVALADGKNLPVDDQYLRDSILQPATHILPGYQPVMPAYQGHIREEELMQLIAYIKKRGPGVAAKNAMTEAHKNYLGAGDTVKSWLLTTDHKRIGVLFLISILFFFAIAATAAALMRLELLSPQGHLVVSDTYNKLFTIHGVLMVWFFLIPSIPSVLGNFLVPLMIGARDMAFPRLNLLSWYLFLAGGGFAFHAVILGGVDTGWTFYTPYSSAYSNSHVVEMALGIFIAGFGSILTGLNFIITIQTMRAPGLNWFRLPLFIWSMFATSIILVLATPVLAITLLLMCVERIWGVGLFNPKLGGDPVLFQHLFWFYSHPAVYIMILPGMGVVSEVIACFARKKIFGYKFVAFSSVAIAVVGFLVWGHHMFVSTQSLYAGMAFSLLSFLVAIPSAIKVFNWTATLHRGSISFDAPMLYVLGFIGLFVVGGLTGLFLATLAVDVHVHGTYFVVAHFHYIMVGGMVTAFMGGLHFWWPKITGRLYPPRLAQAAAVILFIGFNLTFFPQFIVGYLGMPRRVHDYAPEFQIYNVCSTCGAAILGLGYLLPLFYLLWSLWFGKPAGDNPWQATGLEWKTSSPPPKDNFIATPVVNEEAYNYPPLDRDIESKHA